MVLLEDKVVTEKCPFCGSHLENKPEAVEGMLPPESLIPFRVDLRHARESFTKWLEEAETTHKALMTEAGFLAK